MTSVRNIYEFLDQIAPFSTQVEGDNSGMQTGDFLQTVQNCMVCLDITPDVIAQAAELQCELIVSHHPVLFHARKQLLCQDPAWLLARHNIAAIASHTSLDRAPGGVSDVLANLLGFTAEPSNELHRLCDLPKAMLASELAAHVKAKLGTPVQYRDGGQKIMTAAVCGGSGGGSLQYIAGQAQALVTGEAKHSEFLDAQNQGITLIAAGHFETEVVVVSVLAAKLREEFPAIQWHIAKESGTKHI